MIHKRQLSHRLAFVAALCAGQAASSFVAWTDSAMRHATRHMRAGLSPRPSTLRPKDIDTGVTWVSLATDLTKLEYVLNLPLTAYIWTHFMNMRPLAFIVPRSATLSTRDQFIIEWARKAGARIEFVLPRSDDMVSTVAQNARLAAWALPYVASNDYIISADTDIWPISHAYWKDAFATRTGVTIVNGEYFMQNAHGDDRVAISYVGMRADMWASIVGDAVGMEPEKENENESLASTTALIHRKPAVDEVVSAILDLGKQAVGEDAWNAALKHQDSKAHAQWSWDQRFLTNATLATVRKNETSLELGRGLMARRLDRSNWMFSGNAESYSDSHLLSPLTDEATWERLRQVWVSMFHHASWADEYYAGARTLFV